MWQHIVLGSILACLLADCATSTGILPAGPDTYTVTERFAPARGGGTEAQRVAMTKSNNFCEQVEGEHLSVANNLPAADEDLTDRGSRAA